MQLFEYYMLKLIQTKEIRIVTWSKDLFWLDCACNLGSFWKTAAYIR